MQRKASFGNRIQFRMNAVSFVFTDNQSSRLKDMGSNRISSKMTDSCKHVVRNLDNYEVILCWVHDKGKSNGIMDELVWQGFSMEIYEL